MSEQYFKTTNDQTNLNWIEVVQKQVSSLRFGAVQITMHDGRVVQVETTERLRFDQPRSKSRSAREINNLEIQTG